MALDTIAIVSLFTGGICCLFIGIDLIRHPQPMGVMNLVWPLTALYSGPLGLLAYYSIGRTPRKTQQRPFWQRIIIGTLHCGSGCTLGDIFAELFLAHVAFRLFSNRLLTNWTVEYIFAFVIGIVFQYYAIRPMRDISRAQALLSALKSDTLSLTCWQIGMYGWMAVANFLIFHRVLSASGTLFWWMMQVGMLAGFVTAWPVNRWLLKRGIKEAM